MTQGQKRRLTFTALLIAIPNIALLIYLQRQPSLNPNAQDKIRRLARAPALYDVLFVGDSRTYCAFDPELLDPLLGRPSFNLSHWAHWFPTQYPNYQELLPLLKPGTVVVWSIGHQNFQPSHPWVNQAYPIGWRNAWRYLAWGYSFSAIQDNLAASTFSIIPLYAHRGSLRARIESLPVLLRSRALDLLRKIGSKLDLDENEETPHNFDICFDEPRDQAPPPSLPRSSARYEALRGRIASRADILSVRPWVEGGVVTSAEIIKINGNYTRVELVPAFFRGKQREMAATLKPLSAPFQPAPEYWNNFTAIVELFQKSGARLIVNEIEEAPYNYDIRENAEQYRGFMRRVRAYVEGRGIPYLRVPWEEFSNEDYFDYNHLNSRGIAKYSPLFAARLRPLLR